MELTDILNHSSDKIYLKEEDFNYIFEEVYRVSPKYCPPCVESFLKSKDTGSFFYTNPYNNKQIQIIKH